MGRPLRLSFIRKQEHKQSYVPIGTDDSQARNHALDIRPLFSYALLMTFPTSFQVTVVACKGCSALVPTTRALPPEAIAVLCQLCKQHRPYRPRDVLLGSSCFRLRVGVL